ncbi:hypothetical protein PRIPAC_95561 [Pristionchus pacificus]|uniref:Uncharacterized protein n=1 Tax=Pristionchus pacificus TaxID=54126 RepID=A0A2A6CU53_PRIPA|nr:hypothetical protein PRIPAC_95561 [Pristionchus pacificus]|eukprot:PDM81764.1 hypothetical protein PRIPAC_37606 [Pristionchus pacificus]
MTKYNKLVHEHDNKLRMARIDVKLNAFKNFQRYLQIRLTAGVPISNFYHMEPHLRTKLDAIRWNGQSTSLDRVIRPQTYLNLLIASQTYTNEDVQCLRDKYERAEYKEASLLE